MTGPSPKSLPPDKTKQMNNKQFARGDAPSVSNQGKKQVVSFEAVTHLTMLGE